MSLCYKHKIHLNICWGCALQQCWLSWYKDALTKILDIGISWYGIKAILNSFWLIVLDYQYVLQVVTHLNPFNYWIHITDGYQKLDRINIFWKHSHPNNGVPISICSNLLRKSKYYTGHHFMAEKNVKCKKTKESTNFIIKKTQKL